MVMYFYLVIAWEHWPDTKYTVSWILKYVDLIVVL